MPFLTLTKTQRDNLVALNRRDARTAQGLPIDTIRRKTFTGKSISIFSVTSHIMFASAKCSACPSQSQTKPFSNALYTTSKRHFYRTPTHLGRQTLLAWNPTLSTLETTTSITRLVKPDAMLNVQW